MQCMIWLIHLMHPFDVHALPGPETLRSKPNDNNEDHLTEVNAQQVVVQDYSRAYTTMLSLVRQTVIHALDS